MSYTNPFDLPPKSSSEGSKIREVNPLLSEVSPKTGSAFGRVITWIKDKIKNYTHAAEDPLRAQREKIKEKHNKTISKE